MCACGVCLSAPQFRVSMRELPRAGGDIILRPGLISSTSSNLPNRISVNSWNIVSPRVSFA